NKGYTLPGTDYSAVLPTASTNAILTFKPLAKYEDSTITVYLTLSDLGPNFCDTLIKRVIYVAATPVANFKFPQPICDGTPVLFENTSKIAKGDMTYKWYFGDGDSSENVNPVHTFKTYGSYQTRLSATSIKFGIITDTIITVDISEIPSASFKSINACEGTAVKFINQTTVSSGTLTYDWNFGDASTHLTTQNPTHLYSAAGGYKVTLTATTNGCSNAVSKNVYEFAKPKPDFVVPVSSVCASTPVTFPNNSTIALGEAGAYWQFGDGNNSTSRVGLNNYKTDGTFTVKLKMVSEFGCTDSINKQVIIKAAPVASFNNSAPCSVDPTVFINTTTFKPGLQPSYTWTFSDGGTANTTNVSHSWANVGPKNIKLRALQPNGCESTIEKNIVVAVQPNAAFTVADICSGKEAVFQNQTTVSEGNLNYTWDFGDGSPVSNISDPLHMYTVGASQTFNVLLVTNAGGICVDSARSVVTVSEAPVCDFTTKIEWAFGHRTIKFTPTNSSYTSYSWTFGEGGTSSSASPLYSYFYDGNFKVKMTAKNAAGCDCSKEIKVPVFANTDIKEIGEGVNIEVFPNPNSGLFTIVTDGSDNDIVEIEIFNTIGEKVYTGNVNGNAADVDLGDAAKGIYIIKVKTKGKTSTRKVSIN
ncbi:MAG: PKD domain-containing protein, partial [Bacteroidia bacterium]|nr:PKD domain-containing protein [Bacteroidia bacterium]